MSFKVSVVCAWYNRAEYIAETVDSLLAQQYQDFEVIIVNDGSTDPRVRQTLDGYSDPRVRVFHQENTGFTVAIKKAISLARGELIAIQGAGERSLPRRLACQVEMLEKDDSVVGVSSLYTNIYIAKSGSVLKTEIKKFNEYVDEVVLSAHNPVAHGSVMFRKSAYLAAGGYRDIFTYAQDKDLWFRLLRQGSFKIIQENLLDRLIFMSDGAAALPDKLVLQFKFAEFACQCNELRKKHGFDLVDKYGRNALLMSLPAAKSAKNTAKCSLKYLVSGDPVGAQVLSKCSLGEKWTFLGVLVLVASRLYGKIPLVAYVLNVLLQLAGFRNEGEVMRFYEA
jgi:hypothetical protein